jgi:hypothetical protein
MDIEAKFWATVNKTSTCWQWLGSQHKGYGRFRVNGCEWPAHRWAYELTHRPIPDGLQIDHLCRNRACVNPAHMELVTARENVLRGTGLTAINARKTHCAHGHPFDEVNTKHRPNGGRRCKACHLVHTRDWSRRHH